MFPEGTIGYLCSGIFGIIDPSLIKNKLNGWYNMKQKSLLAWEVRIIRRGKCCRAIIIPKPIWLAYNLEIGDVVRIDLSKNHILRIDLKKVKKKNPYSKVKLNKVFSREF